MSTAPTPDPNAPIPQSSWENAIAALEQVGIAAASPFIHSASGQATEGKVIGEVNLAVAALPLLVSLEQAIVAIFHHAKKAAAAPVTTTTTT
jgi:hypothetical protein